MSTKFIEYFSSKYGNEAKSPIQTKTQQTNHKHMASTDHDFLFKVVIIGDSGAGKSSLLLKFCDGEFSDAFISTIGVDFKFKNVVSHNKTCKLQIWDTGTIFLLLF